MYDGGVDDTVRRGAKPSTEPRPSHRRRTAIVVAVVCLLIAALVVVPVSHLFGQIDRIRVGADGLGSRPTASAKAGGSLDVLVVGVHGSAPGGTTTWLPGNRQPISLMVMHFDADRSGATVVGIPLDVEVKVPGDGTRTLADVAASRKPADVVATVESLTGFRMDHLAVLDWQAFGSLIDRLGGIDVSTAGSDGAVSVGGIRMQVTGQDAMKVVTPQRGVDSVSLAHSQLGLMAAVVDGSLHQAWHKSPLLVYDFLDAVTQNLAVDEDWSNPSMARLFLSVWNLRSGDMKYVMVPVACVQVRNLCRAKLDERAAPGFWSSVEQDRIDKWLAENNGRGRVGATP